MSKLLIGSISNLSGGTGEEQPLLTFLDGSVLVKVVELVMGQYYPALRQDKKKTHLLPPTRADHVN